MTDDTSPEAPIPSKVLETWEAPDPPPYLEARVIAQLRGPRRHPWLMRLAFAACVAALAVVLFPRLTPRRGPAALLAGRARVERSPGTRVDVQEGPDGSTRCHQGPGRAAYEVSKGGPFIVETPSGYVAVVGTRFEIEVVDMRFNQAVLGAAAATVVTVASGVVLLSNSHGQVDVAAGQAGVMTEATRPTRVAGAAASTLGALEAEVAKASRARQQLAAQVAALETGVEQKRAALEADAFEAEGKPMPWPSSLPAELRPPRFPEEVRRIFEAEHLGASLLDVDCTEYPCLVVSRHHRDGGLGLEATPWWKELAQGHYRTYGGDVSCGDQDAEFMAASFVEWPDHDGGGGFDPNFQKRIGTRWAALVERLRCVR